MPHHRHQPAHPGPASQLLPAPLLHGTHTAPPRPACAAAFPFFYIEPYTKENAHITQKFTGKISRL
jgi:hypothetical protein